MASLALSLSSFKMILAAGGQPRTAIGRVQPSDVKEALRLSVQGMERRDQIALVRILFAEQAVKEVLEAVDEVISIHPMILAFLGATKIAKAKGLDPKTVSMLTKPMAYKSGTLETLREGYGNRRESTPGLAAMGRAAMVIDLAEPGEVLEILSMLHAEARNNDACDAIAYAISQQQGGWDVLERMATEGLNWSALRVLTDRCPLADLEPRMIRIVNDAAEGWVKSWVIRSAEEGRTSPLGGGQEAWAGEAWEGAFQKLLALPVTSQLEMAHKALAVVIARQHLGDPALVAWAENHPNLRVQCAFVEALGPSPVSPEIALRKVQHKSMTMRKAVFGRLPLLGDECAVRLVEALVGMKDAVEVAPYLVRSIGFYGIPFCSWHRGGEGLAVTLSVPAYEQCMERLVTVKNVEIRRAAATSIPVKSLDPGREADRVRLRFLKRLVLDEDPEVRDNAAKAMETLVPLGMR